MDPVVSVEQMRAIDTAAIGQDTIVGYFYMQKAGIGLLRAVREMFPDNRKAGEIAVVCGKGNNGGDGFVVARLLQQEGYNVMCFTMVSPEALTGECHIACRELISSKGTMLTIDDIADFPHPSRYSLIIDALLGTGIKGAPHGLYAALIDIINSTTVPVLSVDTPSGLNNNTGRPGTPCIKATTTVAMGYAKPGLYFHPGKVLTGTLVVEDLGYPENIVCDIAPALYTPSKSDLKNLLPPRKQDGSKHDHGQAVIVGGSRGMAGSVTMAAKAALRTGCGMVHCATPAALLDILSLKLTEPVLHPLPSFTSDSKDTATAESIMALAESGQALCIGPGFSTHPGATHTVREVVRACATPLVLDADGINAYKEHVDKLDTHKGSLCLTPHRGEWERLFGTLPDEPLAIIEAVKNKARAHRCIIVLKGNPTILADKNGRAYLLPFGNSSLAKAGSGDILSGIITSLAAQGAPLEDAAILGVYLHGTAGKIASETLTEYSVTADDLINAIPTAIAGLLSPQ